MAEGYNQVTIDDIAGESEMSARSVFRYFKTKEDILLVQIDWTLCRILETASARSKRQSIWLALTAAFRIWDRGQETLQGRAVSRALLKIVLETPATRAAYLEKLKQTEEDLLVALGAVEHLPTRAVVAAAFGCLVSAQHHWIRCEGDEKLSRTIHQAMAVGVIRAAQP